MFPELLAKPLFRSRLLAVLLWSAVAALCALRAYLGLGCVEKYSHDAFVMLDGAWRMLHWQRPHVDFSSMLGPAAYLPTVFGLWLARDSSFGFGCGQACVGLLCALWAYAAGRSLSPLPRAALVLCVVGTAVSPAEIGPSPFAITPGMTYNRYVYALLMVFIVECLDRRAGAEWRRGFSSGAILGLLFFLKVTGGLAAVILLAALWRMQPQSRRRVYGLLAGAGAVAVAFLLYLRGNLAAVVGDLAQTAKARHVALWEIYEYNDIVSEAVITLALAYSAAAWLRSSGHRQESRRLLYSVSAIVACNLLLIFGNYQRSGLPLSAVCAILAVQVMQRRGADREPGERTLRMLAHSANSGMICLTLLSVAATFMAGIYFRTHSSRLAQHYDVASLQSFVGLGKEERYTRLVNAGTGLLRANLRPGERVMSLDFSNPFSFALGLPPARGGATTIQYRSSFDMKYGPTPEEMLGDAEVVMLPLTFSDGGLDDEVLARYIHRLHEHYALAAQNDAWQLYRKM